VRYRDFQISVAPCIDQRFWKWTAFFEGRRLTGHASSRPRAIARARSAIDEAVAPIQPIIEERTAKLLREVRELPPGPERDSFLAELEQFIAESRSITPDAKDHHWGKRKLKRDQ
jgi:hypothetical protein